MPEHAGKAIAVMQATAGSMQNYTSAYLSGCPEDRPTPAIVSMRPQKTTNSTVHSRSVQPRSCLSSNASPAPRDRRAPSLSALAFLPGRQVHVRGAAAPAAGAPAAASALDVPSLIPLPPTRQPSPCPVGPADLRPRATRAAGNSRIPSQIEAKRRDASGIFLESSRQNSAEELRTSEVGEKRAEAAPRLASQVGSPPRG